MAREHLIFTFNNPAPVDDDPVTADGAAGTWTANTYSFFVVAWHYDDAIEADKDNAGWTVATQGNWNNVAVGLNETVHINWTQASRRPVRYSVYYQQAAAFDLTNPAIKIAEIDGSLLSADIPDPVQLDTITFGNPNTFNVSPIPQMDPIFRERGRSYDGTILNDSYEPETAITELIITLVTVSMTRAEYRQVMKCIERGLKMVIEDPTVNPAVFDQADPFYRYYYGQFVATDHLLSTQKTRRPFLILRFLVDSASGVTGL